MRCGFGATILLGALLFLANHKATASSDYNKAVVIAKQYSCLGCHATNKKIVGPSFQDVGLKYRNTPNASNLLRNKIQKGGAGSWGVVPMPANTTIIDADLKILIAWILRGAPTPD